MLSPGQGLLLLLVWLAGSGYLAFVIGNVIALARFGPPPTIGVDWPWWKAAKYTAVVFVALQAVGVAGLLALA